jgi:hypothetical protein
MGGAFTMRWIKRTAALSGNMSTGNEHRNVVLRILYRKNSAKGETGTVIL